MPARSPPLFPTGPRATSFLRSSARADVQPAGQGTASALSAQDDASRVLRRSGSFCAEKRRGGVRPMSKELIKVPAKPRSKGIDPAQGVLDLGIYPRTEMRGFGMGVLSDGTPFLTQRGLARLCGVRNAHIGTISTKWNESPQKPRLRRIPALLSDGR